MKIDWKKDAYFVNADSVLFGETKTDLTILSLTTPLINPRRACAARVIVFGSVLIYSYVHFKFGGASTILLLVFCSFSKRRCWLIQ